MASTNGASLSIDSKTWADAPFELIKTPEFLNKKEKDDIDHDFTRTASIMAVIHNMLIRGLNSIYLQAPHVAPADYKDFIGYCHCWWQILDYHHRDEENNLFPDIEKSAGEKGLMDVNVEQHHAFETGVQAYKDYLDSLRYNNSYASFSAPHLLKIIDNFAPALLTHLADEIPTLVALSRFGNKIPIRQIGSRGGAGDMPKTEGPVFFFTNLDRTFEGGLWENFPPIPGPVRWALPRVFGQWNRGWWRFASCDFDGKPKALYAAASKGNSSPM